METPDYVVSVVRNIMNLEKERAESIKATLEEEITNGADVSELKIILLEKTGVVSPDVVYIVNTDRLTDLEPRILGIPVYVNIDPNDPESYGEVYFLRENDSENVYVLDKREISGGRMIPVYERAGKTQVYEGKEKTKVYDGMEETEVYIA